MSGYQRLVVKHTIERLNTIASDLDKLASEHGLEIEERSVLDKEHKALLQVVANLVRVTQGDLPAWMR